MIFTRTGLGLSNEHLFYEVDFVVYCEGTPTNDESSSLDEVFWTQVFSVNGRKVRCKSIGSKEKLLEMAKSLINDNIENVVVAMDRDYDDLRDIMFNDKRVIYSFGYSWENDVISQIDFSLVLSLFLTTANVNIVRDEFDQYFVKQSRELKRVFALDYKYIAHRERLFDRTRPLSIVELGGANPPHVKRKALVEKASTLGRFQTGRLPPAEYESACGIRRFFGKTVARMFYQWFVYKTRNLLHRRSIPYEAFLSVLISSLKLDSPDNNRDRYYADIVAAL